MGESIELGMKVKDGITGFTGVVTGKIEYLFDPVPQFRVEAPVAEGKLNSEWFQAPRLSVVAGLTEKAE